MGMNIKNIAVVGSGLMGHGIAQVFAQGGFLVKIHDIDNAFLEKAVKRIRSNLEMMAKMEIEEEESIDAIMSRITATTNLEKALADIDFVTEAIPEDLNLKMGLFKTMDAIAGKDTILASNTSMLKITDIGKWVKQKERLIITHWFNPPYLIPVVEVVKGEFTSPESVEKTIGLLRGIGKAPIKILKEVPGHLINRIQFAMFRETLSLLQDGVAEAEDIDKAVTGSFGLRLPIIGPLRAIDFFGLDLFYDGMKDIYKYLDNSLKPQDILKERVEKGHIGRKVGKGFFEYKSNGLQLKEEKERDKRLIQLIKILYP